ncbi:MAG: Gfo/Idh/MocA family protein [Planctomycetota bacterium]|jgi:predicted dehydrogenase
METVSWGIIGCGKGCEEKSGPALYGVEGSRLVAVMRRTGDLAADFARRHGVPRSYDNAEELLADPDVDSVYVATPNDTHLEPVLAAAGAGKHVLCEKPMARDTAACRRMIDAGAIGEVRSLRMNDEFPLSHRLDLVHFFFGDAATVHATVEKLPEGSHAAEGAVLHVRTKGGPEGVMNIGWDEKLAAETLDFAGTEGELRVRDLKAGRLELVRDGDTTREDVGPLPATHWGIVENFVAHVNGAAPLACDGVEGRKSTVILDIVGELAPDGGEVEVDYS